MNELTPNTVDQLRTDDRKPFRQFVDDKLIPYGGTLAAIPMGIAQGIGNVAANASLTPINYTLGQH